MRPGQRLGQYELICQTAQGGMASIWLARSTGTRGFKKVVAIKTMLPSIVEDPDAERAFLAEAAVASRIDHPNVVQTLDLCEEGGALYLVMELVRGEPLGTIFSAAAKQGGVPLSAAIRIVSQVAAGLHAAHELADASGKCLGLVHRDVSPQNVLVGFNGVVKVVDFGIAKLTESQSFDALEVGEIKGKVSYMAPEQIRLEPVDRRTDVFATGILLYLLTTGRHPFKRQDQHETALALLSDEPVARPRSFLENYPARLERVVMRALAKDPADRHPTARELGDDALRALPSGFKGSGHDELRAYMRDLLPREFEKQQQLLRVARDAPDSDFASAPASVGQVLKATGRSSSTLRAVAMSNRDHAESASSAPPADGAKRAPPPVLAAARGKRALVPIGGSVFVALAVAALLRSIAHPAAEQAPPPSKANRQSRFGEGPEHRRSAGNQPSSASSGPVPAPSAVTVETPPATSAESAAPNLPVDEPIPSTTTLPSRSPETRSVAPLPRAPQTVVPRSVPARPKLRPTNKHGPEGTDLKEPY